MEDQKEFHFKDAFFIAEKLDAIKFSLPIPPHTEKEFHSKDNYIIWTKLTGTGVADAPAYGQFAVASPDYALVPGGSIAFFNSYNLNDVSINALPGTDITVARAGVYQIEYKLLLEAQLPPP